jgi:hypothetical protein
MIYKNDEVREKLKTKVSFILKISAFKPTHVSIDKNHEAESHNIVLFYPVNCGKCVFTFTSLH